MSIEHWKYSHPTPTEEYFTTLAVLCCSHPDLFEVRGWHKTWIVEKPAQKNNTQCAICHLCGASKRRRKKNPSHSQTAFLNQVYYLCSLCYLKSKWMDAGRILLGAKNNKQINNRHGCYYMNLRPGWRALMRALTGRVLQINGQAGAPV